MDFQSLNPGDIFWLEKLTQYLYKISDEEACEFYPVLRRKIAPNAPVAPTGHRIELSDTITPVEQVALDILRNSPPGHPALKWWYGAILEDENEYASLDEMIVNDPELQMILERENFIYGTDGNPEAFLAIIRQQPQNPMPEGYDPSSMKISPLDKDLAFDALSAQLASFVCIYREAGRPTVMQNAVPYSDVTAADLLVEAITDYHFLIRRFLFDYYNQR